MTRRAVKIKQSSVTGSDSTSESRGRSFMPPPSGMDFVDPIHEVSSDLSGTLGPSLGAIQRTTGRMPPPSGIDFVDRRGPAIHAIASRGLRGTPSPLPYLKEIQSSFGRYDVGHVQAFSGARARSASRAIGAEAYTRGSQVAFSRTPSLHTAAHEAAHTVQQRAGVQLKGGVGEAGDVYERHADAVADKVVQGKSAEGLLSLFAPRIHAPRAPAVQGEWISRHKDRSSLHRYWKKVDEDSEDRKSGWYKRTDGKGGWDKDNIELGQDGGFATEETLLPDQVTSHKTRYDPSTLIADPLSLTAKEKIKKEKKKKSGLSEELEAKVLSHGTRLSRPMKTYRWGEYQYEKNYVVNNGFSLGNVNFGSAQYGPGMYVATTPWGSAGYATEKDGSLIEVTIPAGAFYLNGDKSVATKSYSWEHKKFRRQRTFDTGEQTKLQNNPRFPQALMVSEHSGWMTIKDDNLKLDINFYQPNDDELAKVAPHLASINRINGYVALQIINRQLGNPIPLPAKDKLLSLYINQPEGMRQKVQKYISQISKFEFTPFLLSKGKLTFTDSVNAFLTSFKNPGTPRYKKYFGYIEPTLHVWAQNPFALSRADFKTVVKKPFDTALAGYKKDREDKKKNTKWYQWGLRSSKGDKEGKLAQFGTRLRNFEAFLSTVESNHSDLADDQKVSHVGIKVGDHHGILPTGADKETRQEVISETMLRGVPKLPTKKQPTALVMMGLPGSGKSSVIRTLAPDIENYVVADPDNAKEGLPEFQEGIKTGDSKIASKVHSESKDITGHVVDETRSSRRNLIYDTTGTGLSFGFIDGLKTAGYRVKLVYVHVDLKEAKARVKKRELETHRGVPNDVINRISQMLSMSLESSGPKAHEVLIYNNMKKTPELVWSGSGSSVTRRRLSEELKKLKKL